MLALRTTLEEELEIKKFAKLKNMSVSALLKMAVFQQIEDEYDANLYAQAKREHDKEDNSISHLEMKKELGFDDL